MALGLRAPTLNTAGLFGDTRRTLERRERLQLGQTRGRARKLFGPRFRGASEATLGGGLREQTSRSLLKAKRDIGMEGSRFDLRKYIANLQAVGGERNRKLALELEKMRQPGFMDFLGNLFGAAGMVGAGAMGRA